MLSEDELKPIAELKRLNLIQAEKDYIQDILLYIFYSIVGRDLVFKGGTCLYKVYGLNRFSEDLDFSVSRHFKIEKFINKTLEEAARLKVFGKIKTFDSYQIQHNINLEFKGPLYNGNPKTQTFIGLDISTRSKPMMPPEKHILDPPYRDISSFDIFAMDMNEIIVEKISATYSRKKARDVYDIWFLLKHKKIRIDYSLLNKKLKKSKVEFDKDIFLTKVGEKESSWKTDLGPLIGGELPLFSQVKNEIEKAL
jgi:predicted nucleotidyltransferase component of viral defense system